VFTVIIMALLPGATSRPGDAPDRNERPPVLPHQVTR